MFTVITFETENSKSESRHNIPTQHAHSLEIKGGFYKVQLVNTETNVIEFEYK